MTPVGPEPARRVCLVASTMGGGVGQHTYALAAALRRRACDVALVGIEGRHFRQPVRPDPGMPVAMIGPPRARRALGRWLGWRRALEPFAGGVGVLAKGAVDSATLELELAARGRFLRFVTIEHNLAAELPPRTHRRHFGGLVPGLGLWWYRQRLALRARSVAPHRIVCVSAAIADRLAGAFDFPRRKLAVVPNGVDPDRYRRDDQLRGLSRHRWNVPREALVLGSVGRLVTQKGFDVGLRVFAALRRRRPELDAYLVLVGDGPERPALETQARALGIADRVRFPGETRLMLEALNDMDLFVQPSRWEGMGYALLEAMAAERPVVAFAVGGTPEVLTDASLGWLVPAGDEAALLAALLAAIALTPDGRLALGRRAREHVARNFSAAVQLGRLCDLILER